MRKKKRKPMPIQRSNRCGTCRHNNDLVCDLKGLPIIDDMVACSKYAEQIGLGKLLEIKSKLADDPDLIAVPSKMEIGVRLKAALSTYGMDPERVKYLSCILRSDIPEQVLLYTSAQFRNLEAQEHEIRTG